MFYDRGLPNGEEKQRALLQRLQRDGSVLVVVEQPSAIGALVVALAQTMRVPVGYLQGLSMRQITDLRPDNAKTDRKNASGHL